MAGVTVDDDRDEEQDVNVLRETFEADVDNAASLENEELKTLVAMKMRHNANSIFVQVSDIPVYKATIVKEVLNGITICR